MVTILKKVSANGTGITWLNFSGATSDVVQKIADSGLTAVNVVGITYSSNGANAYVLACRRQ